MSNSLDNQEVVKKLEQHAEMVVKEDGALENGNTAVFDFSGSVDGEKFEGTGYFQKVSVQAPTFPWFWGMLHFDDGSYLDWFMPHISFSSLNAEAEIQNIFSKKKEKIF